MKFKLEKSEFFLPAIINNLNFALIVYNNEKKLIYANSYIEKLTGSTKALSNIKHLLAFVHPADTKELSRVIKETFQGKSFRQLDIRILMSGSCAKWSTFALSPVLDDTKTQIGIQIKIDNLVEKREAEEALKTSEANIRAILNNTSQSFILISREGQVQTFNKIARNFASYMYGIELTNKLSLKDIIPQEEILDFKKCFEFALQGYPVTIERSIKGKYKKDNWFEISFIPVYEKESAINAVCIGILDISVRKKTNQILEVSEKRFRSLVQNSSDLISIISSSGKIKYLSPAIKNIFGYKPSKLLHTSYFNYVHPQDRQAFQSELDNAIRGITAKLEYRFINEQGQWVFLQSIITDLQSDPSIKGIVINSRNITQTKKALEDLNESKHFIQRIANSMPNILFLYEVVELDSYKPIYVNQSLHTVLGYDPDKTISAEKLEYKNLIHPEDMQTRAKVLENLQNATDDEVIESELRVKDKNDEWRWMHVREVVFSKNEKGVVNQILGTAEDITRRKHAEDQLAKGALYDTLTGLPNRGYFNKILIKSLQRQALDEKYNFAVLFLDIDRFKIINDSLGHEIGDQLLIAISQRLKNAVSETDFVARLGGDEFTILIQDTKGTRQIIRAVEKIQRKLNVPFTLNQLRISSTCSIGIAPSNKTYTEPEEILRDADTAMYRAKNRGKNCYALFNKQMHTYVMKILQTEADLRRAIINQELEMYYQPITSIRTGKIISCESLIRWNHPEKGLLTPADFLNVAEETGLMLHLDRFSLFQACRQNFLWHQAGLPKIKVSVNLSLNEFRHKKIKDLITGILKQTQLAPEYLDIELTENFLIEHSEANLEILKDLRIMGISLSIDDFGTGYSSLSYIKRLPTNCLKIDQSFTKDVVWDESTAAIVKSIINLAHNLNLKVVAEGVETQEQFDFLKAHGCDSAQGFLLGKPMRAIEVEKLIRSQMED